VAVVLILAVRPSWLEAGWRSGAPKGEVGITLDDQQEVAVAFAEVYENASVACLDYQEVLFLGGIRDALGFVYYDPVIHDYLKEKGEDMTDTLIRRLEKADPDVIIRPQRSRVRWLARGRLDRWLRQRGYGHEKLTSGSGAFTMRFRYRVQDGGKR
jgi:hypothetical protein